MERGVPLPTEAIIAVVGMFGSMVGVLVFLVRTFVQQNKELVDRFLNSRDSIVSDNTKELANAAKAISESTTTLREHIAYSRQEHASITAAQVASESKIMDAIGKSRAVREPI